MEVGVQTTNTLGTNSCQYAFIVRRYGLESPAILECTQQTLGANLSARDTMLGEVHCTNIRLHIMHAIIITATTGGCTDRSRST